MAKNKTVVADGEPNLFTIFEETACVTDWKKVLGEDFLGRDSSFVHQRSDGRIGWDAALPEEGVFSSFVFRSGLSREDLLKKAYSIARETLIAMDLPYPVRICINNSKRNCTDFKNIYVMTNMFEDESVTPGQAADIFTGLAIHEGCHVLWTSRKAPERCSRLAHALCNIIEDERIERLLGDRMPGYANFLKTVKYYMFGKAVGHIPEEGACDRMTRLFNAILSVVRYPAALSGEDVDDFGETLVKVRDILTPYPDSTAKAYKAAEEIEKLIREKAEEEEQPKGDGTPDPDGDSDQDGGAGEPSASSGNTDSDKTASGKGKPGKKSSAKDDGTKDGEPEKGGTSHGGKPSEEDIRAVLDALSEIAEKLSSDGGDLSDEQMCGEARDGEEVIQDICEGNVERGTKGNAFSMKPETAAESHSRSLSVNRYRESYDRIKRFIPAVRRILKDNSTVLRWTEKGCREGRLDVGKLAEAFQGSDAVYLREHEVKAGRIAVCLLVDESGSMSISYNEMDRITYARDAAILLSEALGAIPNVDLYIYGHTADTVSEGSVEIITYRDSRKREKEALGYVEARANNADGMAIREVAAAVRRQTREKCLLFVISDGAPAAVAYSRSKDGVADTRSAVKEVTRHGFIPMQIAIDSSYEPNTMFDNFIKMTDLDSLPSQLGNMVKKAVLKVTGRR